MPDAPKIRDGRAVVQYPNDHLGIVRNAANQLGKITKTDADEHIGAAYLAMVNAARTWDASKGFQFSTHATKALKFQTFESFKRDCGYKFQRRGKKGRFETVFSHVENIEAFMRLAHFDDAYGEDETSAKLLTQIIKAAKSVSPKCGEEAVMLMARGVHPTVASLTVGKTKKFCYYLIVEIEKRMSAKGQLEFDGKRENRMKGQ